MNKKFLKNIFSLKTGQFLIIGLLSLSACEDEPARLSGNVLPEGEIIKGLVFENHELVSQNTEREAVKTNKADYGIFGIMNDTVFGTSKAGFVANLSLGSRVGFLVDDVFVPATEHVSKDSLYDDISFFRFNNNNDSIFDTWKVDSLVLNLQYQFNDWYGDMTFKQDLRVYELIGDLGSNETEYYSNWEAENDMLVKIGDKMVHPNDDVPDSLRSLNYKHNNLWARPDSLLNLPQYLWDETKIQSLKDSSWVDNSYSPHTVKTKYWNIKLDDELAERIFNAESTTLSNTLNFQGLFKGIYVWPESSLDGIGNLTRINLNGTGGALASHMTIYLSRDHKYFNSVDELRDTTTNYSYAFPINIENVRFNKYNHEIDSEIKPDDSSTDRLYIQGMAGVYSQFSFPEDIRFWADSLSLNAETKLEGEPYRTISNIELLFEVDTTATFKDGYVRYPLPQSLSIQWHDKKGVLTTPVYTANINGRDITSPIFGSNAASDGSRSGIGELRNMSYFKEDGTLVNRYYYYFILRSDYFNYIMRKLDNTRIEKGWDIESDDFLEEFRKEFNNQFFIGPASTTANFKRVKLIKPTKMIMKYYHYNPR